MLGIMYNDLFECYNNHHKTHFTVEETEVS